MNMKANWRIGKTLDNRYKIEKIVGVGGMAVVYKAKDTKLNRYVAIKVLQDDVAMDEESRRRFRTEYQAVALLSHVNIRAVYDVVSSGDTEYIVMEFVDGINLKQYLKNKGALDWKEALHFAAQVAKALSHAHSRGIIHMDIKPANIMLLRDGTAKIADFGIAQFEGEQGPKDSEEGVGSIHYISPEQARGDSVDFRSDIYSLGVVMYEMMTGAKPFDGDSAAEIAVKQKSVPPIPPCERNGEIPEELQDIILKALSPNPDDRYQSADDMVKDLEEFRKSMTSPMVERTIVIPSHQTSAQRGEKLYVIPKDVPRISKSGELSRRGYVRRRARANKISMLLGFGIVIAVLLSLTVFVWRYWFRGIFSEAQRTSVPDFRGNYAETLTTDTAFTELFDFTLVYQPDADVPVGQVIAQDPEPGASRMIAEEGIEVELIVSSGIELVTVPDVVNEYYSDVQTKLQALGLNIMTELASSNSVTKDFVIDIAPSPGSQVSSGTYVTVTVSAGPEVEYVVMPDLVGASISEAQTQLSDLGLICTDNEVTYISSTEEEIDNVLWQNYEPGTEIVTNTKIYLQVGNGPIDNPENEAGEGEE